MTPARFHPVSPDELLSHQGFLRALARELVRDEARAEDLVQDAYVTALERPPRSAAALRSWLATVVRNLASNTYRTEGRRDQRERRAARREAVPSHEVVTDRLEVSRRLIEAVQALAEPYRSTLYLRFYESLGPAEIARRQRVSTDTVKTRLRRGLQQLRGALDADRERSLWTAALAPLAGARGGGLSGEVSKATEIAGGILGMKKLTLTVAALVVVVVGWRLLDHPVPVPPAEETTAQLEPPGASPLFEVAGDAVRPVAAADESRARTEVPVASTAAGPLIVRVLWEEDRRPAENVELLLTHHAHQPANDARRGISDASGRVEFADPPQGTSLLQSFRGGHLMVKLPNAEEIEFIVPRGQDVAGMVVDPTGTPVPGAEVWLSRRATGWLGARIAVRTDASGRFFLRSLAEDRALSARAPGFGSSLRQELSTYQADPGQALELVLVLRGEGGIVEGHVLDPAGAPIAGALVAVGSEQRHAQRASGAWVPLAPTDLERTDARGFFRASGVDAEDRADVQVLADGFPPFVEEVEVRAGETTRTTVTLTHGRTVAGTVRDEAGEPLADISVGVDGWLGAASFFPLPVARSDAEGRYRLSALPGGELALVARSLRRFDLGQGKLILTEGQGDTTWDPVLAETLEISGQLLDADGAPQAARGLSLRSQTTGEELRMPVATDAEGRFRFHAPPGAYRIVLHQLGPGEGQVLLESVAAGTTGILLTLDTRAGEAAFVVGRVHDAAGRFAEQERLQVILRTTYQSIDSTDLEDGTFALGPVQPGHYRVAVLSGDRLVLSTREFELLPGERRDVGTLVTEPTSSVRVRFTAEADLDLDAIQVMATSHERGYHHPLVREGEHYVGEGLSPGAYHVLAFGGDVAGFTVPFLADAGGEAEATILLRRGVERAFTIAVPPDAEPWRYVTLQIKDASGEELYRHAGPPMNGAPTEMPFGFVFPRGRFELAVELDNGLRAEASVEVVDLEEAEQVRLELR